VSSRFTRTGNLGELAVPAPSFSDHCSSPCGWQNAFKVWRAAYRLKCSCMACSHQQDLVDGTPLDNIYVARQAGSAIMRRRLRHSQRSSVEHEPDHRRCVRQQMQLQRVAHRTAHFTATAGCDGTAFMAGRASTAAPTASATSAAAACPMKSQQPAASVQRPPAAAQPLEQPGAPRTSPCCSNSQTAGDRLQETALQQLDSAMLEVGYSYGDSMGHLPMHTQHKHLLLYKLFADL
jgi:hypothetical protein